MRLLLGSPAAHTLHTKVSLCFAPALSISHCVCYWDRIAFFGIEVWYLRMLLGFPAHPTKHSYTTLLSRIQPAQDTVMDGKPYHAGRFALSLRKVRAVPFRPAARPSLCLRCSFLFGC